MKKSHLLKVFSGLLMFGVLFSCSKDHVMHEKILLKDKWEVQQAGMVIGLPGSIISGTSFKTSAWYPASVPSTIMGVLTQNGLYKDIFMGDSIKKVDTLQFEKSWWYRTEFDLPDISEKQHIMLCFDGISYYANIWLNGSLIASRDIVYGTFRTFEFDITNLILDSVNVLAVEVFKQKPGDFGHGFVDWNPTPPDDNMGLWREVFLKITGEVAVKNTFISSDVNTGTLDEATLTIETDLVNYSSKTVSGKLTGTGDGIEFSIPVRLKGGETKKIVLTPQDIEALHISKPRLWWCNNLGEPELYNFSLRYEINKVVSDARDVTFGIREIETYTNEAGHKGFKLNGREILIRGAGWTDDIFFRDTPEKNEIQVQYVKHMNLNTIRFENIWGTSQNIYDLCDRYGILAMVGWSCQWEWENYLGKACDEFGGIKSGKDMDLVVEYLEDQIRYLQNHPSIFVWLMGSDMLPRPALEKRYRDLIDSLDNRPYLAAASGRKSEISGQTGVKMKGPYNYVGPSYWYIDSVNGGAYGFNTETGPGPQIPVMETLEKMIPADKRWPINATWNFHCNPSESFGDLSIFNSVLNKRYGQPASLENYLLKANVQGYEAMKGMFEAFRANRPNATGIIQWMLNSAWPSFYWQLYDYYLLPTSAYYATKKANAPQQLVYNYGNRQVYAVNETLKRLDKVKARIKMADIQGKVLVTDEVVVKMEANSSEPVYKIPANYSTVFINLSLIDEQNTVIADNFYWISGNPDTYDWENTEWYYTPVKNSADFRSFNYLLPAQLEISQHVTEKDEDKVLETTITNNSGRMAFFVNLTLKNQEGKTLYPVFWDDNYVSLLPGDTKTLHCTIPGKQATSTGFTLSLSGWNVKEQLIQVTL